MVTENGHKLVDMVSGVTKAVEPAEDPALFIRAIYGQLNSSTDCKCELVSGPCTETLRIDTQI